jgi:hypothetical protein
MTLEKPGDDGPADGQLSLQAAASPHPNDRRASRRGRFVLGRVLVVLIILAAIVILAPFIYSIWLVMQPWNGDGSL